MKRIISGLLAVLLIVGMVAVPTYAAAKTPTQIIADAAALEGKFPAANAADTSYTADCPVCGTSQTWMPLTSNKGNKVTTGEHYYFPKGFSNEWQMFTLSSKETICIHTNGMDFTGKSRFVFSGVGATMNIMGSGSITSDMTNSSSGVLYINGGTVNVYGTTVKSTATATADDAVASLYTAASTINLYGATVESQNSPVIITKGKVTLDGCTVTGMTSALNDSGAKLTVKDSSIGSVQVNSGTVALAGNAKVTGSLTLPEGNLLDLTAGLGTDAQIKLNATGAFTGSGAGNYANCFTPVDGDYIILPGADGALSCVPKGAVLVKADGALVSSDTVLEDWTSGDYSYIKLFADVTFADLGGKEVTVDVNGFDLTVGGSGKLNAFDSANNTYNEDLCGTITNTGSVQVTADVSAPTGMRYLAETVGNTTTMHAIDLRLSAVTLRASAMGIYYKAVYNCDSVLATKVDSYGVVLSVDNMPGDDFLTETGDTNRYTTAAAKFEGGMTATSGSVFGIMKTEREASLNAQYGEKEIYANPYIRLTTGEILVEDNANANKSVTDAGFDGHAYSLHDVLDMLDEKYAALETSAQEQLEQFYSTWKEKGMNWTFRNIGSITGNIGNVDNSDIDVKFDEGTTDAVCPVCQTKQTWTALTDETKTHNLTGHYYLTDDIDFTGTGDAFFQNGTSGSTLCVHLNGHNITATRTRAIHGSSGVVNVMGEGIVSGYQGNSDYGAAAMINNGTRTNGINLYGGIYRKTANSAAGAAVIAVSTVGGTINVYPGATIDNASGTAAIVKSPTQKQYARKSELGLYGCTVNGKVELAGADPEKCNIACDITLSSCIINGTVEVARYNNVTLSGAPKITKLIVDENERLEAKVMRDGASVGVANRGIFTTADESLKNYIGYFHGIGAADVITIRDGALYCGPDFLGDLNFATGTTNAMCPACAKVVTWKPLVAGSAQVVTDNGDHYYLAKSQTYTGSGSAFVSAPGSGTKTACLHLNGHDLTATATRAIYGSAGTLNVMGTGFVTGVAGSAGGGSAVQINTGGTLGTLNLYGGTYRQGEGAKATEYTLNISDNGGKIYVFDDAIVEANISENAIRVGKSNLVPSVLEICGTVNGNVCAVGSAEGKCDSTVTVDSGKINGTLDADGLSAVVVEHAAKIGLLDVEKQILVEMQNMTDGADITVKNEGIFTTANENAEQWAKYFKTSYICDKIQVKDGALRCKTDYTEKLSLVDGKAFCPACKEEVTWEAISSGATNMKAQNGKHYYLATDITYEGVYDGNNILCFLSGPGTNQKACLHLNDYDITATAAHGIYGGYGVLNVMGSGTVTGYAAVKGRNAAVQTNNSVDGNAVKLYSGRYRKTADSHAEASIVGMQSTGSNIYIYEDADISNSGKMAIYVGTSSVKNSTLEIHGATVDGNIYVEAPAGTNKATVVLEDTTVKGNVTVKAGNALTVSGRTKLNRLTLPAGMVATFEDLLDGSSINVSADGIFSGVMPLADEWLQYITCADAGDWIIVRDKQFYQEVKQEISAAAEDDKTALDTTYAGTTVRYGEMHNHTNSGPLKDDGTGYSPSTGADGKNTLTEWMNEMDRLEMDFAFIVDHGMSIHMYNKNFKSDYFIGGTEPGTTITDSKALKKSPHYNMLFADPAALESIFFKWETKYKPIKWNLTNYPNALTPSEDGYRIRYPQFTTAEFGQLAKDVYDAGGLLVQVHPKYDSYIYSNDPMDYYFADYTGFEISTGSGGDMMYKDNNEAYETWIDMLEMGKKVWATAGSDRHRLPDFSALTTMYTVEDNATEYMQTVHAGNMAPGWVGIRMNVNGTAMGGETSFAGQRLQFSVGDIYRVDVDDFVNTPHPYVAGHTYRVELYDDGGLLMSSTIDPTQMNYFAIDCDETAKFYRVVVWDETDNERIGVGNPIWNVEE